MRKYFTPTPRTAEELKKMYRDLAMLHHPDRGGDIEAMKAVNAEYDELFPRLKDIRETKDGETYTAKEATSETSDVFKTIIDKIIHFEGIKIEFIGTFIWLSGNTRTYKDEIKALGFRWSSNKTSWYMAPAGYRKRSHRRFSMDDIRTMFGSEEIATQPLGKIAG